MRRNAVVAVTVLLAAIALSACGGGDDGGGSAPAASTFDKSKPVTITLWDGFTDREQGVIQSVVDDFHAKYPNVTVKVVGGINDDKIIASLRGGHPPDVAQSFTADNTGAFCGSGGWIDLQSYIDRDKVDIGQFPKAVQTYTTFDGKRCAMPMLADVYGLYWNKKMFADAGITEPPKTMTELAEDAKKLTTKSGGKLNVVGFDPNSGFYEHVPAHYAPLWNAQWIKEGGKSNLAGDPNWAKYLTWDKQLIDFYGYDNLTRWEAGAGDEFSASNAFEKGKLAMMMDGEYRNAFLADEAPDLEYGTAPMPVDDSQPELYGDGYVTGNIVGIPRNAAHKAAAWELVKYLTTDKAALQKMANGLKNIPTTRDSLDDPTLASDEHFAPFLKIYANPHTQTSPITAIGSANQELFQAWINKYESGKETDLQGGLAGVDKQIDAQTANATAGQAP
jgi:multiple sugar transport system substrate-binding protein